MEKDSVTILIHNTQLQEKHRPIVIPSKKISRKMKIDSFINFSSNVFIVFGSIFTVGSLVIGLLLAFYDNSTTLKIFFSEFVFWTILFAVVGIIFLFFGIIINWKRNQLITLLFNFYQKNNR